MDVSVQQAPLRERYLRHGLGLGLPFPADTPLQFHFLGLRYLVLKRIGSHGLGATGTLARHVLNHPQVLLVVIAAADETPPSSRPRALLIPTGLANDRRLL